MERPTEAQLAKWTKHSLEDAGWTVYEEVQPHQGGTIADIVATRGDRVLVVEVKRTLSLEVLGQALGWVEYADLVAVAVPHVGARTWQSHARVFATRSAAQFGIGIYSVGYWHRQEIVSERVRCGLLDAEFKSKLIATLKPEHRDENWARAGTKNGKRVTDFRLTAEALSQAVKELPGQRMRTVLPKIEHHYASDRSAAQCLADCVRRNVIPTVRISIDGTLWPVDTGTDSGHD